MSYTDVCISVYSDMADFRVLMRHSCSSWYKFYAPNPYMYLFGLFEIIENSDKNKDLK